MSREKSAAKRSNSYERPIAYDREILIEICKRIIGGEDVQKICASRGMPVPPVLWGWIQDHNKVTLVDGEETAPTLATNREAARPLAPADEAAETATPHAPAVADTDELTKAADPLVHVDEAPETATPLAPASQATEAVLPAAPIRDAAESAGPAPAVGEPATPAAPLVHVVARTRHARLHLPGVDEVAETALPLAPPGEAAEATPLLAAESEANAARAMEEPK
jgi:hypothetical protein